MKEFDNKFKTKVERKFISFIQKSIVGLKRDFYRKEQLRKSREILFAEPENQCNKCCFCYELHKSSSYNGDNSQLLRALNSLTTRQLQVLLLLIINDFTESEAAERLNISQQSVSKTKSYALVKLRKFYQRG